MDKLVILDFGSQYRHLICRRIREANVYCELLPFNTPAEVIKEIDPKGIIFSGGPASVYAQNAPKPDKEIFKMGKPLLGICYGHQVIVDTFGGKVKRSNSREYGRSVLIIEGEGEEGTSDLFKGLGSGIMNCWMSHADAAEKLPEGFKVLARTENLFILFNTNTLALNYAMSQQKYDDFHKQRYSPPPSIVKTLCARI